ncbi:MAG TPA: major capsid protein, partial [Thiohalobacter sp.]|nr:major capsid protein [Thiohalobacter sp.]
MPIDMFETRTMLQALREKKPPRTFLLDSFFRNVDTYATEAVDVDIRKGKRKLAPFVSPLHEGKVVKRDGYTTEVFKPPYLKPKRPTRAHNFLRRIPGESAYTGSITPQQRAAAERDKDIAELTMSIVRREEWMAAQALTTGQVVVSGEGVEAVVDFQFDVSQTVTLGGADVWTNANSDPINDLRTWRQERSRASGATPDRAIIGSNVVDPLLARLEDKLDQRRIDLGNIQ